MDTKKKKKERMDKTVITESSKKAMTFPRMSLGVGRGN